MQRRNFLQLLTAVPLIPLPIAAEEKKTLGELNPDEWIKVFDNGDIPQSPSVYIRTNLTGFKSLHPREQVSLEWSAVRVYFHKTSERIIFQV